MGIPDLSSRLTQKRAEQREAQAELRLLEVGPRPEEVLAQKQPAKRAAAWQDLSRRDLDRQQQALRRELDGLEQKITHRYTAS